MTTESPLVDTPARHRSSDIFVIVAFTAAFVAALFGDVPLSTLAHTSGLAPWLKNHWLLTHIIRLPGNFLFTIAACMVMLIAGWRSGTRGEKLWLNPAFVFFTGILSGLNAPLKILIGRTRPYHGVPPFELHPFKFGLLHVEASYSFPSGDASIAFAMAMSLSLTAPRLRPLWWTLAVIVGLERIAENAHYPSDVVAGAALGAGVALLARKAVQLLWKK